MLQATFETFLWLSAEGMLQAPQREAGCEVVEPKRLHIKGWRIDVSSAVFSLFVWLVLSHVFPEKDLKCDPWIAWSSLASARPRSEGLSARTDWPAGRPLSMEKSKKHRALLERNGRDTSGIVVMSSLWSDFWDKLICKIKIKWTCKQVMHYSFIRYHLLPNHDIDRWLEMNCLWGTSLLGQNGLANRQWKVVSMPGIKNQVFRCFIYNMLNL